MIDPDSFPFLNIFPFRTYFLFPLWGGGGASIKKETGEIFEVYGEKFDNNKILFFGNARKSRSVLHFSFFYIHESGKVKSQIFEKISVLKVSPIWHPDRGSYLAHRL